MNSNLSNKNNSDFKIIHLFFLSPVVRGKLKIKISLRYQNYVSYVQVCWTLMHSEYIWYRSFPLVNRRKQTASVCLWSKVLHKKDSTREYYSPIHLNPIAKTSVWKKKLQKWIYQPHSTTYFKPQRNNVSIHVVTNNFKSNLESNSLFWCNHRCLCNVENGGCFGLTQSFLC